MASRTGFDERVLTKSIGINIKEASEITQISAQKSVERFIYTTLSRGAQKIRVKCQGQGQMCTLQTCS
jgi:hypothetical protein